MTTSPAPSSDRWVRATRLADLEGPGPHALAAGDSDLVAVRDRAGRLRVYEGLCPHQGALLGEGELDGETLVCRNHRWRFDRATGRRVGGRECLRACPSREDTATGSLFVDPSALVGPHARDSGRVRTLADLPGPRGLPLVGSMFDLDVERLHLVIERWVREYGSTFVVRVPGRTIVVSNERAVLETVLRERPDVYRRSSVIARVFRELNLDGVFSAEGRAWRPQRRLAMEALSHRHLRGFYDTLALVAKRLLARWRKAAESGRVLDVADELKRFTVDVTVQLVFGRDLDTLGRDEDVIQQHLEHIFPALNRRLNAPFPYWHYVRLHEDRELERALAHVLPWLGGLVAEARARLTEDPRRASHPENFLEAMVAARDEDGEPFDDEVLVGNALTMLLAGEDTTAYTLAWAMHELASAPEAERALRAEVDAQLGTKAAVPPDIEHANRLAYAGAVANETMRLRPVAPLIFIEPNEDVVLAGVRIPRGTTLLLPTRPRALEAENFADPHAFRPERWLSPVGAHDAAVSVPFGSGPRICPGRSLALLEMRVVLATVYRNFEVVRVGHANDVRELFSFTMTPIGMRVRLRRRS